MRMKTRIKKAFDEVRAEEQLKDRTREFLLREMQAQEAKMQVAGVQTQEPKAKNHTPATKSQDLEPRASASEKARGRRMYGKWLSAAACLFFIVLAAAGYRFYFSATAVISIDVNPSIELNINRFDTVISVKAYNEDGQKLADQLHVRFMKYMDAFRAIVDSEDFADYRSEEDFVSIAVAGYDEDQQKKILSDMESCTAQEKNMHCYHADEEEITAAHEEGLSCGKYRAYLELKKLDPDVTVDEVRGMTMREIRERIETLSPGQADPSEGSTAEQEDVDGTAGGWRYQGGEDDREHGGGREQHHSGGQGSGRQSGGQQNRGQNQGHHSGSHHDE